MIKLKIQLRYLCECKNNVKNIVFFKKTIESLFNKEKLCRYIFFWWSWAAHSFIHSSISSEVSYKIYGADEAEVADLSIGGDYKIVVTFGKYTTNSYVITVTESATSALDAAKANKPSEIQQAKGLYSESDYTAENWASLVKIFEDAKTTVNEATTIETVNSVNVDDLKASANDIEKISTGSEA